MIKSLLASTTLLIWGIIYTITTAIAVLIGDGASGDDVKMMLYINICISLVFLSIRLLIRNRHRPFVGVPEPPRSHALSTRRFVWLAAGIAVFASIFAYSFTAWITTLAGVETSGYDTTVVIYVLSVCLMGPLAEELIFRGAVQQTLRTAFPAWVSIVGGALLFSAYHLNPAQLIYTLPIGIAAGIIAERTRQIRWAAAYHIAHNTISALLPAGVIAAIANPVLALLALIGFLALIITAIVIKLRAQNAPDTL